MHELSWTEEMRITLQRDQEDSEGAGEFRYNIVESKNFCTVAFAQNMDVGEHAALVLRITSVEQQGTIEEGNSCVVVTGFHLMNADVNALCLWGFSTEDIWKGSTCIIRGLLISLSAPTGQRWRVYQLSLTSLRSSLSAAGRPRSHGCLDGRLGDAGWRRGG